MLPNEQIESMNKKNFRLRRNEMDRLANILFRNENLDEFLKDFSSLRMKNKELKLLMLILSFFNGVSTSRLKYEVDTHRIDLDKLQSLPVNRVHTKVFELTFLFGAAASMLSKQGRFKLFLFTLPILLSVGVMDMRSLTKLVDIIADSCDVSFVDCIVQLLDTLYNLSSELHHAMFEEFKQKVKVH